MFGHPERMENSVGLGEFSLKPLKESLLSTTLTVVVYRRRNQGHVSDEGTLGEKVLTDLQILM